MCIYEILYTMKYNGRTKTEKDQIKIIKLKKYNS